MASSSLPLKTAIRITCVHGGVRTSTVSRTRGHEKNHHDQSRGQPELDIRRAHCLDTTTDRDITAATSLKPGARTSADKARRQDCPQPPPTSSLNLKYCQQLINQTRR